MKKKDQRDFFFSVSSKKQINKHKTQKITTHFFFPTLKKMREDENRMKTRRKLVGDFINEKMFNYSFFNI